MTFEDAELNAKNIAIEKGLYSKEYADAIKEMNRIWLENKMTRREKLINKLYKILWQKTQNNY